MDIKLDTVAQTWRFEGGGAFREAVLAAARLMAATGHRVVILNHRGLVLDFIYPEDAGAEPVCEPGEPCGVCGKCGAPSAGEAVRS